MMCDRYWREGILLAERNLPDPHREGCADCQRAHASREELIDALPLIGEGYTGDPRWQSNVWERLEGKPARARWHWLLEGVLATASLLFLLLGLIRPHSNPAPMPLEMVMIDVQPGEKMRAQGVHVDDWLRVSMGPTFEVWIYHDAQLILRCGPRALSNKCMPVPEGMLVQYRLSTIGQYEVLVVGAAAPPPRGTLDEDIAALMRAGVEPTARRQFSVH